ncbi:MAG TPA: SDR family oxidoreductase [Kofleriaceae bacterium]|nr:SDR family oxidoreductase [Kofleriaceae bacterium]
MEKLIVITGASSGIGAALAEECARRGARLVLAARRKEELEAVAARTGALAVPTDVTHRVEVEALAAAAIAHAGRIDVWVNNAGRGISRTVSELTDEDVDEMMTVNVKSALYGMQAALTRFKAARQGHIINVSSMLGRVPFAPIRSAYSAAKAALNSLTANLRMELADDFPAIHVTTVMPGVVATEFGKHARHGGPDSRALPQAQPVEEVARAIADAIESPRAEVYTRPEMQQLAVAYYGAADIGEVERRPPFARPR